MIRGERIAAECAGAIDGGKRAPDLGKPAPRPTLRNVGPIETTSLGWLEFHRGAGCRPGNRNVAETKLLAYSFLEKELKHG
jgi:hypothetical protein